MPDPINNVGLFGTTGNLPTGGDMPIDPPILTDGYVDPSPTVQVNWIGNGSVPYWTQPASTSSSPPNFAWFNQAAPDLNYGYINNRGGSSQGPGSFLNRLLSHTPGGFIYNMVTGNYDRIPAVRLAQSIGRLFGSNNQQRPNPPGGSSQIAGGARGLTFQGPLTVPTGGALFGYNPAQGGGTTHFDPATGRMSATPSFNPLYTTRGGWDSVANAPANIRWQPNSGTGNFTASQTTDRFVEKGGYAGKPNQMRPDIPSTFDLSTGITGFVNPESGTVDRRYTGQPDPAGVFNMSAEERAGAPPTYGNQASQDAYNAWLMAQPAYQKWQTAHGLEPFGWMTAGRTPAPVSGTISGRPPLPDWLMGG
jgi:hypothetical protein